MGLRVGRKRRAKRHLLICVLYDNHEERTPACAFHHFSENYFLFFLLKIYGIIMASGV